MSLSAVGMEPNPMIPRPEPWRAAWLGHPAGWSGRALYFRCVFPVAPEVVRAWAYVVGIGCHELHLNGRKVGDAVLEPAVTTYNRRVLYVAHEITPYLVPGSNCVGVVVGNGWYGMPKLALQMHLWTADGRTICVATERAEWDRWGVAAGGVVHHGLYDGEHFDARLEDPAWATAGYEQNAPANAMRWTMSSVVEPPGGALELQDIEPMRVVRTLPATAFAQPRPGVYVYDFGTNLAGWARVRVRGPAGTRLTLRFAEMLRADGTVNQDNLYVAQALDTYVCRGNGEEVYEPRFTYHGFRYVQLEGYPGVPDGMTVEARQVRSDVPERGAFTCDQELLRRIHTMVVATEASNLHGVPTDCPQRAERMGWLNDLTARAEEAVLNFDLSRFYRKFTQDIADAQDPVTGAIPDTVPFRWGYRPADPVCIAYLMIPWLLYQHHGDRHTLAEHYPGMRAWVACLEAQATGGILEFSRWGDWAEPGENPNHPGPAVSRRTPGDLVSTAFLYAHLHRLARIARVLEKPEDAGALERRAGVVHAAFQKKYWNASAGCYGSGSQACAAIALALGLVPAEQVEVVVQQLVARIAADGGSLTTGNIATKYLLEVLSTHGQHDLACAIAMRTTFPSWGFMLAHGATTLWERWEHATGGGMNSHNHPMYGSVDSWLYKHVAGLEVAPQAVGCDQLIFQPRPGRWVNEAAARLQTPRGAARIHWRSREHRLEVHVEVPAATTASLRLPWELGGRAYEVGEARGTIWRAGATAEALPTGVTGIEARVHELALTLAAGSYQIHIRRG